MNKATANVVRAIEELYSIDVASRVLIGNKRNFFYLLHRRYGRERF